MFKLAADKRGHLLAGLAAAFYGLFVGVLGALAFVMLAEIRDADLSLQIALVAGGIAALVSGSAAGMTKEKADADDNKVHPGMHGVEVADALYTTAPGALVCVVCLGLALALHFGLP